MVTVDPRQLRVRAGERVQFRCIVSGHPTPTIQWSRVDGPLGYGVNVEGEYLTIPYTDAQHEGAYLCTADNGVGPPQSGRVVLYVESVRKYLKAYTGESDKLHAIKLFDVII